MLNRAPLRAVLFDWDGTLLDSYEADARAYVAMFSALHVPWDLSELKKHYSPDWYCVYRAAGLPVERWAEADRLWRQAYRSERPVLQPGVRMVLRRLARRYKLGLVSGGSDWRVRAQLSKLSLARLFAVRVYGDDSPHRKPYPAPLRLAMKRLRCPPEACVYIGDTPQDVEMARRSGVAVIGVLGNSPVPERLPPGATRPALPCHGPQQAPGRTGD